MLSAKWQATTWPSAPAPSLGGAATAPPWRQRSWAWAQRVWKRQPLGRIERARHVAGQPDAGALRPWDRAPAPPTAGPACRDGAGRANRLRLGANSTILPRYMTATRSEMCAHDREVVGDEEVGEAEPALQVLQQVDDLRLDRHVERGDGLVADDQLGLRGERAGDADALALAAGEFVRIAQRRAGPRARLRQQLVDALAQGCARGEAMQAAAARPASRRR